MHLTDQQLEEALAGGRGGAHGAHLLACDDCRARLERHRATAGRLRGAFASHKAPAALVARVRQATARAAPRPRVVRWMPALATAAAAVLIAVPLIVLSISGSQAQAAQAQLAEVHQSNLDRIGDPDHFYSEDDPAKLAAYFKEKLNFAPAMPRPDQGLALRGCCVAHFGRDIVGSYVVKTPSGLISVIVVRRTPAQLGLKDSLDVDGKTYFRGSYAKVRFVATSLDNYTYSAVANNDVSPDKLIDLLGRLVR